MLNWTCIKSAVNVHSALWNCVPVKLIASTDAIVFGLMVTQTVCMNLIEIFDFHSMQSTAAIIISMWTNKKWFWLTMISLRALFFQLSKLMEMFSSTILDFFTWFCLWKFSKIIYRIFDANKCNGNWTEVKSASRVFAEYHQILKIHSLS